MSDLIRRDRAIATAISGITRIIDGEKWIRVKEVRESLKEMPSAQPEITQEDVELYCRRKCLTLITNELYNEMKIRWSAQPERKRGKWIQISPARIYECSECGINMMTDDIECYKWCHGCGAEMEADNE